MLEASVPKRSSGKSVTAKDVARAVGVSTATVCLSLRNDPRVNARTRELVHLTSRHMNYRPNATARALVRGRSHTVGLVFAALEFEKMVLFSVYSKALQTLTDSFAQRDFYLSVANWSVMSERHLGHKIPRMFHEAGTEGFIVIQSPGRELIEVLDSQSVPLVVLDGIHGEARNACSVRVDECRAAELAVEHLVSLGHRRIANLTSLPPKEAGALPASPSHRIVEFPRGYLRAMAQAGLPAIPGWDQPQSPIQHLESLFQRPERPTALVVYDDQMAGHAIKWLSQRNLRVPGDISIVALHDIGYASINWLPVPAITCKANMQEQMASIAAQKLQQFIEQPDSPPQPAVLEPRLVVRGSSGPCNAKGGEAAAC